LEEADEGVDSGSEEKDYGVINGIIATVKGFSIMLDG
jgi:hypothetical protein